MNKMGKIRKRIIKGFNELLSALNQESGNDGLSNDIRIMKRRYEKN